MMYYLVINNANGDYQMTYSIKQLNKAAAAHNLELVKGSGYFYWVHPTQFPNSVYVNSFNECTKEMWLEELAAAVDVAALFQKRV
jgi:hypothetical protein